MKTLLILDHAVHRDVYRPFEHWIRFVPEGVKVVRAPKEDPPPPARDVSHVLVTGSEDSILEPAAWTQDRLGWIREARDAGVAVLGSCHGHQMIAAALAGPRCVRRSASPEFGWFEIEMLDDEADLFRGASRPAFAFCSHFDEVAPLPEGFRVLGRSAGCAVQAFQVEGTRIFGVQAHPEILPAEGERLLADFSGLFPRIQDHAVRRPARDTGLAALILRNFLAG